MTITFLMDGKEVTAEENKTLLDVARENGIDIPTICFHEATTANALCRICVVEVEGQRLLQPACIVRAANQHEGADAKRKSHPCAQNDFGDARIHNGFI